jgi:hypothetical protein
VMSASATVTGAARNKYNRISGVFYMH